MRHPGVTLGADDCRKLLGAPALGVAVVASSTPDCSGIGHARVVLDVQVLSRGTGITRLVTSRSLIGTHERHGSSVTC